MGIFNFLSKNFWLLAICTTIINVFIFRFRSRKYIVKNPELEEGYRRLFKGYIIWFNIPWLVMGFGLVSGNVSTMWHFFRPKDGNPYVLMFFCSIFIGWILGAYWIFFKSGAETLTKYHGFSRGEINNPNIIKLLLVICLVGGILAVYMMWTSNIPMPNLP